ncbi:MAG: ribosome assembly RNA-binding protein YhbY [Candidatus Pelethousia sp.]|nr:ribosome assembly RNA-binding protein YhbY [Candidatus Pelethousia sp.]
MTGKQRAGLRAMANTIQPIFQIGKGGISDTMIEQIGMALDTRELIKITVLETAQVSAQEAGDQLCQALGAQLVQCIGRKITIYRRNEKEPKIEL